MKFFPATILALGVVFPLFADWHYPLYLDGGTPFPKRVGITVRNPAAKAAEGEELTIPVHSLPLAGEDPGKIRVVDEKGQELLHRAIPEGKVFSPESGLVVPVSAGANGSTVITVYYGSKDAWELPDMLPGGKSSFTDSFEAGSGKLPPGWSENSTDDRHRNSRSESVARTGKQSLETRVEPGSKPNWVKFFREIPVRPGTKFRVSGWVKGENVTGGLGAGFFLHIGTKGNTSRNPLNKWGNHGSFDWRKIEFEGVVPEGANLMLLGTVLHAEGGCAWFDDIEVALDNSAAFTWEVGEPETLKLDFAARQEKWELDSAKWPERYSFQVCNFSGTGEGRKLCALPVSRLAHGNYPASAFRLFAGGGEIPFLLIGGEMIFEVDALGSRATRPFNLYLAADRRNAAGTAKLSPASSILSDYEAALPMNIDLAAYEKLVHSEANLLKNPSFEGEGGWISGGEANTARSTATRIVSGGLFGAKKALLDIPAGAPADWYGFRQAVGVKQGRRYLVAGFAESENSANVWAHEFSRSNPKAFFNEMVLAAGGGWKPFTMSITARHPDSMIELHLTSKSGKRAYDGIVVAEIAPVADLAFEAFSDRDSKEVRVWQVNPLVKIFEESVPRTGAGKLELALARNEAEGLQLAIRSSQEYPALTLRAGVARNEKGDALPAPETGVIGQVQIDAESRYLHFTGIPAWRRCIPGGSRGELYPDPILPGNEFRLERGKTLGLYLRFRASRNTAPGLYRGEIALLAGSGVLKTLPYEVKVWNFALPDRPEISAIFDNRFGSGRKFKDYTENEAAAFLAESRLSFDEIPAKVEFSLDNGTVKADFTRFDQAAKVWFEEWNIPLAYLPLFREHFNWGHPPKPFLGVNPYPGRHPYRGADRGKLTPEYRKVCREALRLTMDHLREKGWEDRFLLYIADEPHGNEPGVKEQMTALCDMIHEVEPKLRIYSSTWRLVPEWVGKLDVWGIGVQGQISPEEMEALRKSGAQLMITTDGQMCLDTPFNALERLLPLYAWKHGTLGYEFWGADWLTRDPFEWGIHRIHTQEDVPGRPVRIRYPNGDGYIFYPGKGGVKGPSSSIRLESLRDGVEDYSYYVLLDEQVRRTGDPEGAQLLKELKELISIPNAGGRKSEQLLPDPDVFTRLRDRIGEKIQLR